MQLTEKHIELEELTGQENTAYNLNGAGLQVKEIAEKNGYSIRNCKKLYEKHKRKTWLIQGQRNNCTFLV